MTRISQSKLSRRLFLGGAGVAIALPAMRSLMPSSARADHDCTAPKRFLGYYIPCGIHMPAWTPSGTRTAWALTPILGPRAVVKREGNILTGPAHRPAPPDAPRA